ncbi:MAG: SDR family oxidoreductase [Burkholderiales bacterium]
MAVGDLFALTGKVALVTGGSRGIGLAMAQALGEMGARVALVARKEDELAAATARLHALGIEAHAIAADLSQPAAIAPIVDAAEQALGPVDILLNNAGNTWAAPAESYPDEAWRRVMSLNVDAQFYLAREVARRMMIPRRRGKIINVASIAGLFANPPAWQMGTIAYNTSKAALIQMTRALATEWGRHDINVNAICPGFFPTRMSRGALDRIEASVLEMTPLGRLGSDQDLMGVVVFLASEASRHVTGQALVVDGGCTLA